MACLLFYPFALSDVYTRLQETERTTGIRQKYFYRLKHNRYIIRSPKCRFCINKYNNIKVLSGKYSSPKTRVTISFIIPGTRAFPPQRASDSYISFSLLPSTHLSNVPGM